MPDLDDKIRNALNNAPRAGEPGFDEQPVLDMVRDAFRGRQRWLAVWGVFVVTVFTVLMVLAAIQFFRAESVRDMLTWLVALAVCFAAIGMSKLWFWMRMDRNAILREVKRLELEVSRLACGLAGRR